ncbi:MAG: sugar kinase [Pseudomonadales bacterium]|nr:sugar kinase [Pseudomonadales bacterium]
MHSALTANTTTPGNPSSIRIGLIGECMIELRGQLFGRMDQYYGGDTLNTATYLSRLQREHAIPDTRIEVSYITAMGQDKLSQTMIEHWQADGINTDLVLIDPKRHPGLYMIQLDESGERHFTYWRSDSAARHLLSHADFSHVEQRLGSFDWLFLSGISYAILPANQANYLLNRIRKQRNNGQRIAFDSNYRPALWGNLNRLELPASANGIAMNTGLEWARQLYQQQYRITDLIFVTFDDEQQLWGDTHPEQTISRLHDAGIPQIVVKVGEKGCLYSHIDSTSTLHSYPAKEVPQIVDTTAAGDAFNGGFLHAYLNQQPIPSCCEQANLIASRVIQHRGAIIPPPKA